MSDIPTKKHEDEERFEAERHDRLYRDQKPNDLRMAADDWTRFDGVKTPTNAYAASIVALGDINGKKVLDMGCGDGWLSVILAKRGGTVWGYDISPGAIEIANERATANNVSDRTHFDVASAYELPYADGQFDIVIGQAILHHLGDKIALSRELKRVMKRGSKAVFVEPFGASPLLRKVRKLVPIKSESEDDPDQEQLTYRDFDVFKPYFDVQLEEYQLISRLDRIFKGRSMVSAMGKADRVLIQQLGLFKKYARTVLVTFRNTK